ncbi:hypothetical protein IM793_21735 [Pedobacter sp. MR2016-19]|uniref:hypothetical protein n=1 Tax=Pedobacter sp. MR2016-19 TaxID=2780089 RepID=UPI0018741D45|nr:hypothetical protein [Pedobacter sp. MR2016-19]MBE5321794.1 hypothetical protein [Pedobacter sp. MR2016-19]
MREEEIINYTQLADARIIEIFKLATIELPDAERLFSHVLNAQHIWAQRISGKTPLYGVWDIHSTEDFESLSLENFRLIREALNNHPLDKRILYTNTRGDQYENRIDEISFI